MQADTRKFDIKIAQKVLNKCQDLDNELNSIHGKVSKFMKFVEKLSIEEYISDPGSLLLKVYFKVIHLKNQLVQELSISYTKAKLLVISYELTQIMEMIDEEENPLVMDNTDFQSTLISYKNFVSVLIDQLDRAVLGKDTEQIEECLNILNDVEKMYESVRMNFFLSEELNEWEQEQNLLRESSTTYSSEEDYHVKTRSRRTSLSSTTSSLGTFNGFSRPAGTISEELPYLLQAFNEAKHLEQELSNYQTHVKSPLANSPSLRSVTTLKSPPLTPSTPTTNSSIMNLGMMDKRKSHLSAGFSTPNMGFQSNMLNNLYGLHPGKQFPSMNKVD
jgi:hypothetical protein